MIEESQYLEASKKACLFCSDAVQSEQHMRTCPGVLPENLEEKPTYFKIVGRGNLCKNCFSLLSPKDWEYHRKAQICHKSIPYLFAYKDLTNQLSPSNLNHHKQHPITRHSQQNRSLPEKGTHRSFSQARFMSEGHTVLHQSHRIPLLQIDQQAQTTLDLAEVVQSILTPLLRQWTSRYNTIDINVLLAYLTSGLLDFGNTFFKQPITVPTWNSISSADPSIPWTSILQKPQNLLNERFVDAKLATMEIKKQARVIKALNKLSKKFRGLLPHRQVPRVDRQHTIKKKIRILDLFLLLKTLLSTRKKNIVHLALDFYIILLSGQRFLADWKEMEKGLIAMQALNKQRNSEDLELTYLTRIGKTGGNIHDVALNPQLCLLLKEFSWSGFHPKTYRIMKRMSEWLGVNGYCLKYCMLSTTAKATTDLHLAQRVAGHRSLASTRVYTSIRALGDNLRINKMLVVPGLDHRFGKYEDAQTVSFLDSLSQEDIRYSNFRTDWLHQLLQRLYMLKYNRIIRTDDTIDYMMQDSPNPLNSFSNNKQQNSSQRNQMNQLDQAEEKPDENRFEQIDQERQEELRDLLEIDNVVVYGQQSVFRDNKFEKWTTYAHLLGQQKLRCRFCPQPIPPNVSRLKCIFCGSDMHLECSPSHCSCITINTKTISLKKSVPLTYKPKNRQSSLKILMPKDYHRRQTMQEQIIIELLALRRFRYTRVPIEASDLNLNFPERYWQCLNWIHLPSFSKYLSGDYWPPVQVRALKDNPNHPVWGTEFGIFAQERILPNVLIGQYACDLLMEEDLVLGKKTDSIMYYIAATETNQAICLVPKDYCGMIPLINTARYDGEKNNCKSIKLVVDGAVRILIITATTIQKDQQLLYSYGVDYKFQ